jgi:HMG (high mobility group) box
LIKIPILITENNSKIGIVYLLEKPNWRGSKITKVFPDILVTTKHQYEIVYKYTYTCSNPLCGLDFGRQRKLDLTRLGCGACKSKLTQTKPAPKSSSGKENKSNPFGMFVKDHFAEVKRENPGITHKDIMAILSKRYREQKDGVKGEISSKDSEIILIEDSEDEVEDMMITIGILNLH